MWAVGRVLLNWCPLPVNSLLHSDSVWGVAGSILLMQNDIPFRSNLVINAWEPWKRATICSAVCSLMPRWESDDHIQLLSYNSLHCSYSCLLSSKMAILPLPLSYQLLQFLVCPILWIISDIKFLICFEVSMHSLNSAFHILIPTLHSLKLMYLKHPFQVLSVYSLHQDIGN